MTNKYIKHSQFGSSMKPDKLQSVTIDLLRFPLAIMVIFIHMCPNVINLIEADFDLISGHGIYNLIKILFSHVLTHIAVPTFFFISGFLFFINLQNWSWSNYKRKIHSRVKTLLIPYILWNAVPFLLRVLKMLASVILHKYPVDNLQTFILEKSWHVFYDYHEWGTTSVNWLGNHLRMTGPFDLPLWFLRDLIIVTVLAPIIYYAIKKTKFFTILVLFLAYISHVWTLIPGFSITAFFFFTTGAYFALCNLNVVHFANKYKIMLIPVCLILLIFTTIYDGTDTIISKTIYSLFVCTGVFTAFHMASICVSKYKILPNKLLVSSCFFIYAIHDVEFPSIGTPLYLTRKLLHMIIPGSTGLENSICYLFTPFVTALLCILLLQVGRRILPKTTLMFSGNK